MPDCCLISAPVRRSNVGWVVDARMTESYYTLESSQTQLLIRGLVRSGGRNGKLTLLAPNGPLFPTPGPKLLRPPGGLRLVPPMLVLPTLRPRSDCRRESPPLPGGREGVIEIVLVEMKL